ncbi:WD40 domain containing protein [Asbolus verrucosus]|uniref:WD40 domain containing protein n=1 Tax=Asbolus verrucosus TaxID=1661398 RepID=A0A482V7I7_ASBVE|nr:WD40 domain containing protein [Asbolus verrucosus]
MDDFDESEDFQDVEVIYLDDQVDDEAEDALEDVNFIQETEDEEVEDLSKLTFSKHTKSVFSSDLTKDGQLAVTGGEDDNAFVWSTTSGEIIFECTGHKDSVTAVGFNSDNQLLATGDMAGMIQVWNVKDHKLIWCYEGDDMEWLIWHPLTNILISGSHSGDVYIWQVLQGNCKMGNDYYSVMRMVKLNYGI